VVSRLERRELSDRTREVFIKAHFSVAGQDPLPTVSFDLVCRRDDTLLMVKVVREVNDFTKVNAGEMKLILELIGAAPLLVGTHRGKAALQDGVAYLRYGIPMLTLKTLHDHLIEEIPPMVFSAPGGFFVRLDGERLAQLRASRQMSRGALASVLGVSSRAVRMYEEGMAARLEVAVKLEEISAEPLVRPLDIFCASPAARAGREEVGSAADVDEEVFAHLGLLGYEVIPTTHCPFDAVVHKEKGFFAGLECGGDIRGKARAMTGLARLSDYYSVLFLSRDTGKTSIEGTPVVTRRELRRMEDPEDIVELIEERTQRDAGDDGGDGW